METVQEKRTKMLVEWAEHERKEKNNISIFSFHPA